MKSNSTLLSSDLPPIFAEICYDTQSNMVRPKGEVDPRLTQTSPFCGPSKDMCIYPPEV